jgi:hypothetical protein
MFIAVFLHELGHSSLVWYACDSPQLGGIEREVGEYMEKVFFGGIPCAEFELEPMRLMEIGTNYFTPSVNHNFYRCQSLGAETRNR